MAFDFGVWTLDITSRGWFTEICREAKNFLWWRVYSCGRISSQYCWIYPLAGFKNHEYKLIAIFCTAVHRRAPYAITSSRSITSRHHPGPPQKVMTGLEYCRHTGGLIDLETKAGKLGSRGSADPWWLRELISSRGAVCVRSEMLYTPTSWPPIASPNLWN